MILIVMPAVWGSEIAVKMDARVRDAAETADGRVETAAAEVRWAERSAGMPGANGTSRPDGSDRATGTDRPAGIPRI